MRVLSARIDHVISGSVVLTAGIATTLIAVGVEVRWLLNVGLLIVALLEGVRLTLSRDVLNSKLEEIASREISGRNIIGLFLIIPFIIVLPVPVKLGLLVLAGAYAAFELLRAAWRAAKA